MDLAAELASSGAPSGTVVVAEEQTQGRGTRDHVWVAPPGSSLLMTALLRPSIDVARDPEVSLRIAEVLARVIERETGVRPMIKPPNDLLIDGKKVSGILAQTSIRGETLDYLLLGIGLNVNIPVEDLPLPTATSLLAITGKLWDRTSLLMALLAELETIPGLCD